MKTIILQYPFTFRLVWSIHGIGVYLSHMINGASRKYLGNFIEVILVYQASWAGKVCMCSTTCWKHACLFTVQWVIWNTREQYPCLGITTFDCFTWAGWSLERSKNCWMDLMIDFTFESCPVYSLSICSVWWISRIIDLAVSDQIKYQRQYCSKQTTGIYPIRTPPPLPDAFWIPQGRNAGRNTMGCFLMFRVTLPLSSHRTIGRKQWGNPSTQGSLS